MERTLHKVHDAEKLFYYFFSENESNNLILRLVLRSRIDKSILKKALNKTLERYPNFRQTPVLDRDGYLYTRDNDQEAEVYAYDPEPVNLASKATNGYLFRVMYEGDTLWISIFHSLCDGSGFKMFTRSLLYYYFTFSGMQIRNEDSHILTTEVTADPTEMSDPFLVETDVKAAALSEPSIAQDGLNPFKPTDSENVFLLPESVKQPDQCRDFGLCRYILEEGNGRHAAADREEPGFEEFPEQLKIQGHDCALPFTMSPTTAAITTIRIGDASKKTEAMRITRYSSSVTLSMTAFFHILRTALNIRTHTQIRMPARASCTTR